MNNDQTAIIGLIFYLTMICGVLGLMLYEEKFAHKKKKS